MKIAKPTMRLFCSMLLLSMMVTTVEAQQASGLPRANITPVKKTEFINAEFALVSRDDAPTSNFYLHGALSPHLDVTLLDEKGSIFCTTTTENVYLYNDGGYNFLMTKLETSKKCDPHSDYSLAVIEKPVRMYKKNPLTKVTDAKQIEGLAKPIENQDLIAKAFSSMTELSKEDLKPVAGVRPTVLAINEPTQSNFVIFDNLNIMGGAPSPFGVSFFVSGNKTQALSPAALYYQEIQGAFQINDRFFVSLMGAGCLECGGVANYIFEIKNSTLVKVYENADWCN